MKSEFLQSRNSHSTSQQIGGAGAPCCHPCPSVVVASSKGESLGRRRQPHAIRRPWPALSDRSTPKTEWDTPPPNVSMCIESTEDVGTMKETKSEIKKEESNTQWLPHSTPTPLTASPHQSPASCASGSARPRWKITIPHSMIERAKHLILDGIACGLVGARVPWSKAAFDAISLAV